MGLYLALCVVDILEYGSGLAVNLRPGGPIWVRKKDELDVENEKVA